MLSDLVLIWRLLFLRFSVEIEHFRTKSRLILSSSGQPFNISIKIFRSTLNCLELKYTLVDGTHQCLFLSVNLISQKLNLFYDLISRNFFDLIRAFLENVIRLSLKCDLSKRKANTKVAANAKS